MKKIIVLVAINLFLSLSWVNLSHAILPSPIFLDFIDLSGSYTDLGSGTYQYFYTLSAGPEYGTPGSGLSHWWLELLAHKIPTLSDFDPSAVETYFNEEQGPDWLYTTLGNLFQGHHWGVKWDTGGLGDPLISYSFISTHGPVLDDSGAVDYEAYSWFAKGGNYFDYGTTLGPNGNGIIPEPATMSLFGLGLLGLIGVRRRKR